MEKWRLGSEARGFADKLATVLNGTVCCGIRLAVVERGDGFNLGYRLSSENIRPRDGIPVCIGRQEPRIWLDLQYRITADRAGRHVMVQSSFVGLAVDPALEQELVHFDYERKKENGYPEAHIQVIGSSPSWRGVLQDSGRVPAHLHLPVGGRRYRPSLEDVVEFLVVEKLATPHLGWETVVRTAREDFHRTQLGAAVRNDPETAQAQLLGMGYLLAG